MEMKTEADTDCMILEYPHDDSKPTVGMLLRTFIRVLPFRLIVFLNLSLKLTNVNDSRR